jgi:hypothetical protein
MRTIAAVGLVISITSTATADSPGVTPVIEPPAPVVESYRSQTATADGVAIGLAVVAGGTHNRSMFSLALASYAFGGPIVHLYHDRPGRALGSLALRVGLPLATTLLLVRANHCTDCDDDQIAGALAGLTLGVIGASVIDAAFLAKGDEVPARPWTPTVTATHSGLSLGIAGRF